MKPNLSIIAAALLLSVFSSLSPAAFGQGTAFTYQGRLQNNGSPASGGYDLQFTLYATNSGGVAVAGPVTTSTPRSRTACSPRRLILGRESSSARATGWILPCAQNVEHIGPMAQDFHAAFGLNGGDDKHISVVDEGGVDLTAIKGLNQKLETDDAKLEQENDLLTRRLDEVEAQVRTLAERTQ